MFGTAEGAGPGSPGQLSSATAAAAVAKADRLARELEEAEEEISAMSSKIKQQVSCNIVDCRPVCLSMRLTTIGMLDSIV